MPRAVTLLMLTLAIGLYMAHVRLAEVYETAHMLPLRQAIAANPRDARPQFYLGLTLEQLGQKDDARAALDRFISLAPSRYERQIAVAKQHLAALR